MTSGGHIDLVLVILVGVVVIGLVWEAFRRTVSTPRREAYYQAVERPRRSLAESRSWERRLAQLHVINDDGGSRVVRVFPKTQKGPRP